MVHKQRAGGRTGGRVSALALIEALPGLVVVTDVRGAAQKVNARWQSFTGQSREQTLGHGWLEALEPGDRLRARAAWAQLLADPQPFDAVYRVRHDGTLWPVHWHCAPLGTAGRSGWLCTGMPEVPDGFQAAQTQDSAQPGAVPADTAQSNAGREQLLENLALDHARLGEVLAQLPLGVLVVDAGTRRVRLVNAQTERVLGMPLTPGMTLERIERLGLHQDGARVDGPGFSLHRALEGQHVAGREFGIRRPDGSRTLIRVSTGPVYDRLGQMVAAVLTCEDLTRQRLTEAEDERASDAVQRAREALTLHGGQPVTPARFLTLMGELHEGLGQSPLEGRLIALLLLRAEPVSLREAAGILKVSKVAVSKVTSAMLERGDLQIIKSFSSREHLLALTDHNYIRDLSVRRVASWAISILCDSLLRTNHLAPAITEQIRAHLETHTRVAVALEQVLSPIEQRQAQALAEHLRENWDAVPPRVRSPTRVRKRRTPWLSGDSLPSAARGKPPCPPRGCRAGGCGRGRDAERAGSATGASARWCWSGSRSARLPPAPAPRASPWPLRVPGHCHWAAAC
jgi:PAS domain S-box-containing protein